MIKNKKTACRTVRLRAPSNNQRDSRRHSVAFKHWRVNLTLLCNRTRVNCQIDQNITYCVSSSLCIYCFFVVLLLCFVFRVLLCLVVFLFCHYVRYHVTVAYLLNISLTGLFWSLHDVQKEAEQS